METTVLRVMTWNVLHLRGDVNRVAAVLRAADPDLVCLQEGYRLPGSGVMLRLLARRAGLRFVAGGWRAAGGAILCSSRVRPVRGRALGLKVGMDLRIPRRGVVLAEFETLDRARRRFGVTCIHLALDEATRARHTAEIIALTQAGPEARIVAGDFNETPDGAAWQAFSGIVVDEAPKAPKTFPARHPKRRIDAILVSSALRYRRDRTGIAPLSVLHEASDHLPVVGWVTWR